MKIDLVQPRHTYAPTEGLGHIYMPTSLLTAGARLLRAGIDVTFHDENLQPRSLTSRYAGINLLGAPYIPEVMALQQAISQESGEEMTYLLGGQVISGLSEEQFSRLFGKHACNGNDDHALSALLQIDKRDLLPPEKTSLIPAYEKLSDKVMKEYLSREFSLYVSQGCKFACDFCAAVRSFRDPVSGDISKATETYRDPQILEKDLEYLVLRSKNLGINQLQMYMSNLDVFQTPEKLLEFSYAVQSIKERHPDIKIGLRGLATVHSYVMAKIGKTESIKELVKAGFHTVGFGLDGMTAKVWNAVGKGHNTEEKGLLAIRSAKEDFGITPEVLMVFGHANADTVETLKLALEFTEDMVHRYGAVPRPHVSKAFIPGNNGWRDPRNEAAITQLLHYPGAFQSLDFTALPSSLTHPDPVLRALATTYFLQMCQLEGNTTKAVLPIKPQMTKKEVAFVKASNLGKYDR